MARSIRISTSKIKTFKQCRKKFFFKYVEQIETPVSEALRIGKNYHEEVEKILKGETPERDPLLHAFQTFILPNLPEIKTVEKDFELRLGYGTKLVGYIDAVTVDNIPVEHKTTKDKIDEKYLHALHWDEQVTTYLMAMSILEKTQHTKMIYTAVQKPSIKLKKTETQEEYFERCFDWYDDPSKAQTFAVVRSADELDSWVEELKFLAREIKTCKNFYRNPNCCCSGYPGVFCDYSQYCLDYNPEVVQDEINSSF